MLKKLSLAAALLLTGASSSLMAQCSESVDTRCSQVTEMGLTKTSQQFSVDQYRPQVPGNSNIQKQIMNGNIPQNQKYEHTEEGKRVLNDLYTENSESEEELAKKKAEYQKKKKSFIQKGSISNYLDKKLGK